MKTKITKVLSIGVIAMGVVHCAATFTPVIAGKLATLDAGAQTAFLYMSLMCGALLILGGALSVMLAGKMAEYSFLRKPFLFTLIILAIDGVMAAYAMPKNPCAWAVLVLTLPLLAINIKRS
ncbi:hypothetical protein [Fibrobacter sp. UWEL]|uniref:hypothetical protein n=1 Tax=Fibrobacter sp. UWEL TaxID=1896209 RepID=UPI00091D813F|nr:hypothetical protein [Fibrobacter sp. UWEL]SHL13073.1 hypothetical protein SAMN05720468_11439 [Fibrobacter sp. UWEL]